MSRRKYVEYVGNKHCGFVDVGNDQCYDSAPVAKDAFVLMVVSLNNAWKIPIGYFLVDGLSGEERANLVTEGLHRLHNVGVQVVSLTCDGPSCHFTMMKALGADMTFNTLSP